MAKDRAQDAARSVGSHEKMMGALGRAAGWERVGVVGAATRGQKYGATAMPTDRDKSQGAMTDKRAFIPGKGHAAEIPKKYSPWTGINKWLQGGKGL